MVHSITHQASHLTLLNSSHYMPQTTQFVLHVTHITLHSLHFVSLHILSNEFFPLPASHFTYHKSFLHVGNLTTFQTKNQIRQNKNFSLKEKKTLETPLEPLVHEFHQKPVTSGPLLPSSSKLPCVGVSPYSPFPGTAVYYAIGSRLREKLSDDLIVNSPFWLLFISL